ncbi:MFS transporter [Streptomyces ochraceiscleroticus]|uniref:MFS transporter n=1 Tax=Streptomyces ochraceiscleroticus TaxID=47761 RepID=A0ABW1MND5_9ACTN|nr:MFS transporter [Streptomyces ochraceiscleroticus]
MPTTPSATPSTATGPSPASAGKEAAAAAPRGRTGPPPGLLLAVISLCTAVTVANIYLAAPLLGLIARGFGLPAAGVSWITALSQLGYAIGLLSFAPLGDTANRRRLIAVLSVVTAAAMAVAGLAPGLPALGAALLVAGATTVIPQLLVPLVAERAPAARRGLHVAAVVAGLFTGIVAARVLGGLAGQAYGWRAVLLGSAVLTVLIGSVTAALLPPERREVSGALLTRIGKGVAQVPGMLITSADLRRACLRQGGLFGVWSALWTAVVLLLTGAPYHFSTATAGLFGLFGLVSAMVAPLAGGLIDRFGTDRVVGAAYALTLVSVPLFLLGGHQLWALCLAAVLVHAGLVCGQVANQTLALTSTGSPATANTAYMVAAFFAGALASALTGPVFTHWHWPGVCALALLWLTAGRFLPHRRPGRR